MDQAKSFSRRSFFVIIFWMLLLASALVVSIFLGRNFLLDHMAQMGSPDATAAQLTQQVAELLKRYSLPIIAGGAGVVLLMGLILWLVVKSMARKLFKSATAATVQPGKKKPKAAEAGKQQKIRDQRLFLHLLTVLQREGRLIDFFFEDLEAYADDQIGAAVRSIHQNCRKVLDKHLALKPVVVEDEGAQMTVTSGFDPDSVKLTGMVTGEPPFSGIVRHKGWQARKLDLPALSGVQDASIIAPAEVEVQ